MSAPSYRWSCHRCAGANEPGADACMHCGFPATASGYQISAAARDASLPAGNAASAQGRGIPVRCPACQSGIAIPTEWGFAVAVFQCAKCGAKLSSNAWLLSILCLVIYVPLLGAAYHVWPTFTFLIGDWLLLWLVGALCFIFIRAKKIDQPGIDPPGSTPA